MPRVGTRQRAEPLFPSAFSFSLSRVAFDCDGASRFSPARLPAGTSSAAVRSAQTGAPQDGGARAARRYPALPDVVEVDLSIDGVGEIDPDATEVHLS
jgi:hypothetical protein